MLNDIKRKYIKLYNSVADDKKIKKAQDICEISQFIIGIGLMLYFGLIQDIFPPESGLYNNRVARIIALFSYIFIFVLFESVIMVYASIKLKQKDKRKKVTEEKT